MVMSGMKGYALKCESCGHEDAAFFNEVRDELKKFVFKVKGYKRCPECGGKMKIDPGQHIAF